MKIALICPGIGKIKRGHETFARTIFDLLKNDQREKSSPKPYQSIQSHSKS